MFDYLVDHALKNAWCTPGQDMQAIVKPARLTGVSGAFSTVRVQWQELTLPERGVRFHVYQIGQLHPLLMGLFPASDQWVSLAQACALQSLITNVYTTKGVELPRHAVWYMVTDNKNLVLAVKDQPTFAMSLPQEELYFRVYSNAYFNSVRANGANDVVVVNGKTIHTQAEILQLQNEFNYYSGLSGEAVAYINGYYSTTIDLLTVRAGDVVEYVYDGSIAKTVDFRIGDLSSFVSELDNKHKYLLHYNGSSIGGIDYQDDLDLYLMRKDAQDRGKGVYYHRNQADAVRMVTHKDYSVPVAYISAYVADHADWSDADSLVLRMYVRKSGYSRPLVNENNRILELYKLTDAEVVSAMVGVDSVLPEWRAAALENSSYVKLMAAQAKDVTAELVQQAYGYNAISKLLCDTPSFTRDFSGVRIIDVPYGLQNYATAYEYDIDGHLLGHFSHPIGSTYIAHDVRAHLVEMLSGASNDRLDEVYGNMTVQLDPTANYRMYVCPIEAGVVTNDWQDVTDTGQYAVIGNTLTWLIDPTKWYPLVRSDKVFLAYDLQLMMTDGLLKFSLNHRQLRNSVISNYVMQVPMGELELFLNGRSLIEGVDYVMHFPQIVIFNKTHLVNQKTAAQKIHVRFSGFCDSELKHYPPEDVGYVDYNLLSHNSRYDIRDDKVMRIVVGGKLYARSALVFAATNSGVTVPHANNGFPYMVRDIVTPLRGLTEDSTYSLRERSMVIDRQIADYMTLKLPQPVQSTPSVVASLYQLVSPFAAKLLFDLEHGILTDPRLKLHYNDMDVLELCKPYEYLLAYDPTQTATETDPNYTVIHCHHLNEVLAIDVYTYKFLTMVNRLYLKNRVQLSHITQLSP